MAPPPAWKAQLKEARTLLQQKKYQAALDASEAVLADHSSYDALL